MVSPLDEQIKSMQSEDDRVANVLFPSNSVLDAGGKKKKKQNASEGRIALL